jgi:uncharacterized membrane protein
MVDYFRLALKKMTSGESRRRSIVKMITYRAILTALLAVISWVFTGNIGQTTVITIVFSVSATVIYYLHERVWNGITWGRQQQ